MVGRWFNNLNDPALPLVQGLCMRTFDDQVYTFGTWIEDYLHSHNPTFEGAKFNKKQHCVIEYFQEGVPFESRLTYTVGRCASDRTPGEDCPEYQTSGQMLRAPSTHFPNFYIELRMEVIKDRNQTQYYPYLFHIQYKSLDKFRQVLPSQARRETRPLKLVVRCMKLETPGAEFNRELVWWTTHFAEHMDEFCKEREPNVIVGNGSKSKRSNESTSVLESVNRNVRRKIAEMGAGVVPTLDLQDERASDLGSSAPPSPPHVPEVVASTPVSIQTKAAPVTPHTGSPQIHSPAHAVAVPLTMGEQVAHIAGHMLMNAFAEFELNLPLNLCLNQARAEFAKFMPQLFAPQYQYFVSSPAPQ